MVVFEQVETVLAQVKKTIRLGALDMVTAENAGGSGETELTINLCRTRDNAEMESLVHNLANMFEGARPHIEAARHFGGALYYVKAVLGRRVIHLYNKNQYVMSSGWMHQTAAVPIEKGAIAWEALENGRS